MPITVIKILYCILLYSVVAYVCSVIFLIHYLIVRPHCVGYHRCSLYVSACRGETRSSNAGLGKYWLQWIRQFVFSELVSIWVLLSYSKVTVQFALVPKVRNNDHVVKYYTMNNPISLFMPDRSGDRQTLRFGNVYIDTRTKQKFYHCLRPIVQWHI